MGGLRVVGERVSRGPLAIAKAEPNLTTAPSIITGITLLDKGKIDTELNDIVCQV